MCSTGSSNSNTRGRGLICPTIGFLEYCIPWIYNGIMHWHNELVVYSFKSDTSVNLMVHTIMTNELSVFFLLWWRTRYQLCGGKKCNLDFVSRISGNVRVDCLILSSPLPNLITGHIVGFRTILLVVLCGISFHFRQWLLRAIYSFRLCDHSTLQALWL